MTRLTRQTFATARALDFFDETHLTNQIGCGPPQWRLALLKELIDNGLDAAEATGALPAINVTVTPDRIAVSDNGGGLPPSTLRGTLDVAVHTSDKRLYVAPTRGRLGNALLCLYAASYVIGKGMGRVVVEAGGRRHEVLASLDGIAGTPRLELADPGPSVVKTGTSITADLACSVEAAERPDLYRDLVRAYALFNPHATFTFRDGERDPETFTRTQSAWTKWRPQDPPSAWWYRPDDLRARIAAQLVRNREAGTRTTLRAFLSEFRDLSGTVKRKQVQAEAGLRGTTLDEITTADTLEDARIQGLLQAMQRASRPVRPDALGVIGKAHLEHALTTYYGAAGDVRYKKVAGGDPIPFVLEMAFAVAGEETAAQRTVVGINWSSAVHPEVMLPDVVWRLAQQRVDRHDPVIVVLHIASPVIPYADTGKSRLALRLDDDGGDR
jgi:DNA topoisomerase VI subunit B